MKLVIATPLYPPEIGGPAVYAKALEEGLPKEGITVELVRWDSVRHLPRGIRHGAYWLRVRRALRDADAVLALDTWSVGVPAWGAAWLAHKQFLVRIGGDFLWEAYVERTRERVKFSAFYASHPALSFKERLVYWGTRVLVRRADALVFNTSWQRGIWQAAYGFDPVRAHVIENQYPAERESVAPRGRIFVAAARPRVLKNTVMLADVFTSLKRKYPGIALDTRLLPPDEHAARIRDCYAVVIPSISEISPNLAIDAIRYGKPFIAPEDSGMRERLEHVGLFVDTNDEQALMGALEELLEPTAYARTVERVRACTYSHSWSEIAREFRALIV